MTLEEVVAKLFKMGEIVNLSMFKEDSIPTKNELLTKAGDILLPHEPITSVDLYCQANNTEKLNDFINNHLSKVEHSSSYEMLLEALIKACKFTNNKDSMYKVAKICLDKELAEKAITAFEFAGHPLPKANVINRANHCLENKRFKDAVTLYEYAGMEKVKLRELLINKGDYYLISGDIHPAKECYLLANAKERVEFIEKNKLNLLEIKKDIEEFYKDL